MRTSIRPVGDDTSNHVEDSDVQKRSGSHRTAWMVLWSAFLIFWVLVVGAFLAARDYYENATLARNGTLSIEQGIVLFKDAISSTLINAQDNMAIRDGDELLVGQGARASVAFPDGSKLQIYSGSEMRFERIDKSRFHDTFSTIGLHLETGTFRLEVAEPATETRTFSVSTPHGTTLVSTGNFGFTVSELGTRVSSREGTAAVQAATGKADIQRGEKVLFSKDALMGPLAEGDALLANGDFSHGFDRWTMLQVDEPGRPVEPGQRALVTEKIDGKDTIALKLSRVSPKATHNETGLSQVVNKDVSDYQSLQLKASVKVDGQSLSGGGYMGYEYPLMIRVKYRDATGGQIDWTHGFFTRNPEERATPNGEQVDAGKWVVYNGNLMDVKPVPVHIIAVEVLGAGHSFESSIANVELTAK